MYAMYTLNYIIYKKKKGDNIMELGKIVYMAYILCQNGLNTVNLDLNAFKPTFINVCHF